MCHFGIGLVGEHGSETGKNAGLAKVFGDNAKLLQLNHQEHKYLANRKARKVYRIDANRLRDEIRSQVAECHPRTDWAIGNKYDRNYLGDFIRSRDDQKWIFLFDGRSYLS